MLPSSERLLEAIRITLDTLIVPDLSAPQPIFSGRIIGALAEHLALRSKHENKTLVDSNEDMQATINAVIGRLKSVQVDPIQPELLKLEQEQIQAPKRDIYCSYESLTDENNALRRISIELRKLVEKSKDTIGEKAYDETRKMLTGCSHRMLERDYVLIQTMEDFQKSLYSMN